MKLKEKKHQRYSTGGKVFIARNKNKLHCLEEALKKSGFIEHLNRKCTESKKSKKTFHVVIKANIMTASFETDIAIITDPEMVEYLIEKIRAQGFENISVVESHNVYGSYYQDRTVENVAKMVGYSGAGYNVVDLTLTKEPYDYGDNELGKHFAGLAWRDADYRVSFAKNKTHWQCYYTGCLKNVYGCLPEMDKLKHYHGHRREFDNCTILIHEAFPVDFAFLDAFWSGDGFAGHVRDNNPNKTNTVLCGENCYAVDWVQGEMMGLKPRKNRLIRKAIRRWGAIEIERIGDTTPFPRWENIFPLVDKVTDILEEIYFLSYIFSRILAFPMDPRFKEIKKFRLLFRILRFPFKIFDLHAKAILVVLMLLLILGFIFGFIKFHF